MSPVTRPPFDLSERLLGFASDILDLTERFPNHIAARRIGDQLLRSGTSVGANYEESRSAESRADFAHKLQIALKEARESRYWLRLISRRNWGAGEKGGQLIRESTEIIAILAKSVATTKSTLPAVPFK